MATSSSAWTCPGCGQDYEKSVHEVTATGELWCIVRLGMCTGCAIEVVERERYGR